MCATFELEVYDDSYNIMYVNDVISGLLRNGYILNLTPCRYKYGDEESYTLMVEVGDIDESWIDESPDMSLDMKD